MRGEKTLSFEFTFPYSENGGYAEANTITIRAPGLGKFHVHSTMQAYVMDAISTLQAKRAAIESMARDGEDDGKPADDEADPAGVWQMMAMGLGVEKFPKFAEYVTKVLTNAPKLASIGEGKVALSDEVWTALEDNGGIEAIHEVLGTFVGFFLESPKSARRTGNGSSTTSASPTRASTPSARKTSRSQN